MATLGRIARTALVAALAVVSCKEAPSPQPPGPDPAEIVKLEREQRAHGTSSSSSAAGPAAAVAARPSAGPDVLALLGGLKPSDKLGSVDVVHISPVMEGSVAIELGNGAESGTIFFVKLGDGPVPPASSEKYGVYYRDGKVVRPIATDVLQGACTALADRLRKNEAGQPAPSGLTEFSADKPKSSSEKAL